MFRPGIIARLIFFSVATGQVCRSPINVDTTYNNAVDKEFDDLQFDGYDSKFSVNASFVGAVGRIDGFNASSTPACLAGGGLEERHCLVSISIYGDYNEYASPHSVDGRHYAVEFQLLHRSNRGTTVMLVIFGGVHFDSCWWSDGCTKESLVPLISALETAKKTHAPARIEALSPSSFLPSDTRPFYVYEGNVIGDCGTAATYFLLKERVKLPDALMGKLRWSLGPRSSPKVKQVKPAGRVYSRDL